MLTESISEQTRVCEAVYDPELAEQCADKLRQIPRTLQGRDRLAAMQELLRTSSSHERDRWRRLLESFIVQMKHLQASDIDLGGFGCAQRVWYRIHGVKEPWAHSPELPADLTDFLLLNSISEDQAATLMEQRNLDFSYIITSEQGTSERFRADMYFDLEHLALNMRRIDPEIRPFRDLGLHPQAVRWLSLKYLKSGLTLVTGITGSGKSSTLDTIIDMNNRTMKSHIVIISSPVELVHTPQKSVVRHREVGRDVSDFRDGVTQALRQDPDMIVIGELRDQPTILAALEVADSGHKTFSTLHTASAVESIDRIIGEVPVREQERVRQRLADVLTCVISQKLVPTRDGKRVLAKEVLLATPSVKAAVRNNHTGEIYQMIHEGSRYGMQTLEQDLARLVGQQVVEPSEAVSYANNKKRLTELLQRTGGQGEGAMV